MENSNLAKALVEVQKVITNAPTNSVNPFFKSKYTDLATAVNHCRPILAEHGLAIYQTFDGEADMPVIVTTLLHESGESVEGRLTMKPVKADPQSIGSLLTYGRRYSYLAMVGIAPEDDDANSAQPQPRAKAKQTRQRQAEPPQDEPPPSVPDDEPITEGQIKKLNAMMGEYGMDRIQVKLMLKVASLKDLSKDRASKIFDKWDTFVDTYNSRAKDDD
jgi:hypothetical protein